MRNQGINRLKKDFLKLQTDPVPNCKAVPLPSNIYEWHFIIFGPADTDYEGGIYHGKLVFPQDYPFKPPAIYMLTPNGRFKTNTKLCLSISDYHPESWNPSWSVSSIMHGLISFMTDNTATLGSIETPSETKRALATESWDFNEEDRVFRKLFPEMKGMERPSPPTRKQSPANISQPPDEASRLSNLYTFLFVIVLLVAYIAYDKYGTK